MAQYDAADCLARVRRLVREPSNAQFPADSDFYAWLTEAENECKTRIASFAPKALIGAPVLMTTADGGKTYTFGVDGDGQPIFPLGGVELFATLESIPDFPMQEYDEYLVEGDRIRIPGNATRSFAAGGPYARFVAPTWKIDGTPTNPTLEPVAARELLVLGAGRRYAVSQGRADLLGFIAGEEAQAWARWTEALQGQFMSNGAVQAWGRPFGRLRNQAGFGWRRRYL
jgi:hypothetical protein